jgi:hypothetical protein
MLTFRERFLAAYIETAMWADGHAEMFEIDDDPTLAPEAETAMREEAGRWFDAKEPTIQAAIDAGGVRCGPDFDEWGHAGHDFWLTRNGHGAGYWDGDWPEPFAAQLSEAAHKAGGRDLYLGDDGLVWASGLEP